jgi:hypothetical protein
LGYQNTTSSKTILAFWEILRIRVLPLYPGEGDRIMSILAEIEQYQHNIDPLNAYASAEALIQITNRILNDEYSILSQEVKMIQCRNDIILNNIILKKNDIELFKKLHLFSEIIGLTPAYTTQFNLLV